MRLLASWRPQARFVPQRVQGNAHRLLPVDGRERIRRRHRRSAGNVAAHSVRTAGDEVTRPRTSGIPCQRHW